MAKVTGKTPRASVIKKVAKKRPGVKKVKKKTPERKAGSKKRSAGKKSAIETVAPPTSAEAKRLAIVVQQTEQALEKASNRLADARKRVVRAAETAHLKRTQAALAAADRAREEVAAVNERRLEVAICLTAARDAIKEEHDAEADWNKLEQALKEAMERYEKVLKSSDRRVDRKARERRNR